MKKYNTLIFVLVAIISLSICLPLIGKDGSSSAETGGSAEAKTEENTANITSGSQSELIFFSSFNQAYNYIFSKKKSASSYKASAVGSFKMGYDWYSLTEYIVMKKNVDNASQTHHSEFTLRSSDAIGRNIGVCLNSIGDSVEISRIDGGNGNNVYSYDYSTGEHKILSSDEYSDLWGTAVEDLSLDFDYQTQKISNKTFYSNGNGYTLKFQIEPEQVFGNFWKFINQVVRYDMLSSTVITVKHMSYTVNIDRYGNIIDLSVSAPIVASLKKLKMPYGILPNMNGTVSYVETYSNWTY